MSKDSCESIAGTYAILSSLGQPIGTGHCQWGARPLTVTEIKLSLLMVLHALMALYFCNPVTLLGGKVCCSPYRNKEQTDARTTAIQAGYPYNYEPLNFFRAATSLVCCFFAGFQILTYRRLLGGSEETALIRFVYVCGGVGVFYSLLMFIRYQVWSRGKHHLESGTTTQGKARDSYYNNP